MARSKANLFTLPAFSLGDKRLVFHSVCKIRRDVRVEVATSVDMLVLSFSVFFSFFNNINYS